jgi:hypothetical protein
MQFATAAAVMNSWERVVCLYSLRKLTSYIFKHWIINDDDSDHNNVRVVTNDVQRIARRSYATTCTVKEEVTAVDAGEARSSAIWRWTYESFTNSSQECHPIGKALVRSRAISCGGCGGRLSPASVIQPCSTPYFLHLPQTLHKLSNWQYPSMQHISFKEGPKFGAIKN